MEGNIIRQLIERFLKNGDKCFIGVEASDGSSRRNYKGFILANDGDSILFNDQFLGEIGIAISEIKRITPINDEGVGR